MLPDFNPEVVVLRTAAATESGQTLLQGGAPVWEETTLWDDEAVTRAMALIARADANDPFAPHIIKKVPYAQLPEEPITEADYEARLAQLRSLHWGAFTSHDDGAGERYCTADSCEIDLVEIRQQAGERVPG